MQSPTDASQDKIKVRLQILSEKQSLENNALVTEIAVDISKHLNQAHNYRIETPPPPPPPLTEKMGPGSEFWVWIAVIGEPFVQPFTTKLAEKAIEKLGDLLGEILEKVQRSKYRKIGSNVKIRFCTVISDIDAEGSLEYTLDSNYSGPLGEGLDKADKLRA